MARRPAALLLCLVFALLCVLPGFVAAEAETKTIRVGWYETPFNRRDSLGRRSGYAYEYQRKIAAYTGWKYEYVEGSWSELLQMAMDGRIDLMSDVSYAADRTEYLLYARKQIHYCRRPRFPEREKGRRHKKQRTEGPLPPVGGGTQRHGGPGRAGMLGRRIPGTPHKRTAGRLCHPGYLRESGIRCTGLEDRILRFLFRGQQKPSGSAGGAQCGAKSDPG